MSDTSAAAPPPTPLKMATICGIAVIFTSRAAGTPMTAPMAMATMMSRRLRVWEYTSGREKVHPTATSMPVAPTRLPSRARLGELRPLRARMNPTMATR